LQSSDAILPARAVPLSSGPTVLCENTTAQAVACWYSRWLGGRMVGGVSYGSSAGLHTGAPAAGSSSSNSSSAARRGSNSTSSCCRPGRGRCRLPGAAPLKHEPQAAQFPPTRGRPHYSSGRGLMDAPEDTLMVATGYCTAVLVGCATAILFGTESRIFIGYILNKGGVRGNHIHIPTAAPMPSHVEALRARNPAGKGCPKFGGGSGRRTRGLK
jgi:hypothetical protein